jgi:hypothetical protein
MSNEYGSAIQPEGDCYQRKKEEHSDGDEDR